MALPAVFCLPIFRLFVTSIKPPARAAEIAVVAPLDKILNYAIPVDLAGEVCIGSRVRVPLGRRHVVGYVMNWAEPGETKLKDILEVIDPHPLFHQNHAAFYLRAARYYVYPPGQAVRTALPAGLSALNSKPGCFERQTLPANEQRRATPRFTAAGNPRFCPGEGPGHFESAATNLLSTSCCPAAFA